MILHFIACFPSLIGSRHILNDADEKSHEQSGEKENTQKSHKNSEPAMGTFTTPHSRIQENGQDLLPTQISQKFSYHQKNGKYDEDEAKQ